MKMANDCELLEFLEYDAMQSKAKSKRRRMDLRERCDPFTLDEEVFLKRYRLTKELTRNLCDELRPLMKNQGRATDLSVETKVLIALSFYATGSGQRPIGNNEGHFVAQQTVSTAIAQVTACLNSPQMREKYIQFPSTEQECNRIRVKFYQKFRIPGVLGCIGGSRVAIIRPVAHEERYYCNKRYHSLNVQLICDADMQITSVEASNGGATCNSLIWDNHPLKSYMEDQDNNWLLGDSGYQQSKSIMTPILNAAPETPEAHYNDLHAEARNVIDHTIGLLKARFRRLLVHRVLHYPPQVAGSIVNACVILHNICNRANIPVEQLGDEELLREAKSQQQDEESELPRSNDFALQQGLATRSALVRRLWESRHLKP